MDGEWLSGLDGRILSPEPRVSMFDNSGSLCNSGSALGGMKEQVPLIIVIIQQTQLGRGYPNDHVRHSY